MSRFIVASALFALATVALPAGAQSGTPTSDSTTALPVPAISAAGDPIPRPANDSLFRRARRLVSEGNGVAGRALVDSLLAAADPSMPAYGDALYWHGALAPTAAAAEADYRRVIVEYPLAYYSGDALLAIAELEQARGDRVGAMQHLQRFVREHPDNPGRGIAALGVARLAFEQRDSTLACSMLTEARRSVSASDVELRNQVAYYANRCAPMPAASTVATTTTTAAAPAPVAAPTAPATTPATPAAAARAMPAAAKSAPAVAKHASTAAKPARTAPAKAAPPERTKPATRPATKSATKPTTKPTTKAATKASPATRAAPARRTVSRYTVQVAAYDTRADAEALVKKLAARGVKARVSGASKPFRVRLALHAARKDAIAELTALQKRGIDGFVAEEDVTAGARAP